MTSSFRMMFVCAAITAVSATSCFADTCNDVLTSKNFNVYDANTRQLFQSSLLTDMCREEFKNTQDFNTKARSLGSGANYFAISGFLNLNSQDESANLRTIYNKLCEAKDYRLLDFVSSNIHVQSTDAVVDAWKRCVTEKVGLFSTITMNPENNDFIIHVVFKPSDDKSKLTLRGQPGNAGYECRLADNRPITNVDVSGPGDSVELFLHCNRPSGAGVIAVVNTNAAAGAIGPYTVPSRNYIELTQTVEKLRAALQDNERTIEALRGDLTNVTSDLKVWGDVENERSVKRCPEGHYAVGIKEVARAGRGNGYVESAYVVCRPLKID